MCVVRVRARPRRTYAAGCIYDRACTVRIGADAVLPLVFSTPVFSVPFNRRRLCRSPLYCCTEGKHADNACVRASACPCPPAPFARQGEHCTEPSVRHTSYVSGLLPLIFSTLLFSVPSSQRGGPAGEGRLHICTRTYAALHGILLLY